MSKYRIIDCEQRTPIWFAARAGKITGSKVSELIMPKTLGLSNSKQAKDLLFCARWESTMAICLDEHFQSVQTWQMANGTANEGLAKEYFLEEQNADFDFIFDWKDVGFILHESNWFGISPDYVSVANEVILEGLEIKSAESKNTYLTLLQIKNDTHLRELKFDWWCQCQLSMYVTGLKDWWFLGYVNNEELPKRLFKVRANEQIFETFDKIITILNCDE